MQPEEIETSSTESDEDISDKVIVHSLQLLTTKNWIISHDDAVIIML